MRWLRRKGQEDDFIPPVLGTWIMRIDGKLDEILGLLRGEDDEPEP